MAQSQKIILVISLLLPCMNVLLAARLHKFVRHFEPLHYDHETLLYEHHRMRRTVDGPNHLKLQFQAFGRDFNIRLKPDRGQTFHKDMKIFKDGVEYPKSLVKTFLYVGEDLNDTSARVHGSMADGVFNGFIHTRDNIYAIEPSERYPEVDTMGAHSVIYRHSDVDMDSVYKKNHQSQCGAASRQQQRSLAALQQQGENPVHKRQNDCTNTRDPTRVQCTLTVTVDEGLYNTLATGTNEVIRMGQVMSFISNIINAGSVIYKETDFDSNPGSDNIQFNLRNVQINTTSTGVFANPFLGVEAFLTAFSNKISRTCLSYAFTNRDFDNGVLGLAFVGTDSGQGGICSTYSSASMRTLNTGVVTITNFGQRVPQLVTILTFAHEAGHNFGSEHDPIGNAECDPPTGGTFIMFASASTGAQPNNRLFSPCSRRQMFGVFDRIGQDSGCGCFLEADDLCGNGLVDPGEDCDCGISGMCTDNCCNVTSCRVKSGFECSPQQGVCCDPMSCYFYNETDDFECSPETECAFNQTCNGAVDCPVAEMKTPVNGTNIPCGGGSAFCRNGTCSGSICVPLGLESCECELPHLQCHICCKLQNGSCASTILLAEQDTNIRDMLPDNRGNVLQVGFPCNNFTGYCDFFNNCRIINSDGALRRLAETIFNSVFIQNAIQWITMNWWVLAVGGVAIFVLMFVIVLICHFLLPRPKHMKTRSELARERRRERRQQQGRTGHQQSYPSEYTYM